MAGEFQNLGVGLKTIYRPQDLKAILNEDLMFRPWLKKGAPTGASVKEGEVKFNMYLDPPQNVGQSADGGTWAPPKDRTEVQAIIKPSLFTASFQIGLMTQKTANTGKSAFSEGEFRRRTEETMPNLGKFIETTYIAGTGNGARAKVESDGVSYFVAAQPIGVKLIRPNMLISVRQGTGTTVRDSVDLIRCNGIDPDNRYIYYNIANETYGTNGEKTLVANDLVYVVVETTQVIAQTLGVGVFANGLRNLIDDGTESQYIHTQDRTTVANAKLKSIVDSSGSRRAINEELLNKNCQKVHDFTGKKVTDLWCGPGVANDYNAFVIPSRMIMLQGTNPAKMGTGYKYEDLVHHAVGVQCQFHVSHDMVPGELFGLTPSTLFLYEGAELDWWTEGGMLKPTPGTASYKASMLCLAYCIENFGCDFPRGNFVIRDLQSKYDGLLAAV